MKKVLVVVWRMYITLNSHYMIYFIYIWMYVYVGTYVNQRATTALDIRWFTINIQVWYYIEYYIHIHILYIYYKTIYIIYDINSLQQQPRATNGGAVKFSGGDRKPHQIKHLHVIIIYHTCTWILLLCFSATSRHYCTSR